MKPSSKKKHTGMNRVKKTAFSAILCSLSVIILYIGSLLEMLDLTMCAIASLIIIFAVIEMGGGAPYLIYAVTSILALILLPNKFPALLYLVFAGLYPIFKSYFERLHYVISWILKISFFNTMLLLLTLVTVYILHMPDTGIGFTLVVFTAGNVVFVLYDITVTKLITLYLVKIRSMLKLKNYFDQ